MMLNLLGLVLLVVLTVAAAWVVAGLAARLVWGRSRRRMAACAGRVAAELQLTATLSPDPRMALWKGNVGGAEVWLATGAHHLGPQGAPFDSAGPCFVDDAPLLTFRHLRNLVLVLRLAPASPLHFTFSSMYGVQAGFITGDEPFDRRIKLGGTHPEAIRTFFGDAALRDALLGLLGPDGRDARLLRPISNDPGWDGTGVMVAGNEQGLVVYWGRPREPAAAMFSRAFAQAGMALTNSVRGPVRGSDGAARASGPSP